MINNTISQTITAVRFPLAIMVVCIHACTGYECFVIKSFAYVFAHIAVPIFFFISGYLFFSKLENWDWSVWNCKIKNRFKSLFLPYILWNSVYAVNLFLPKQIKKVVKGTFFDLNDWFSANGGFGIFWNCIQWNLERTDLWGNSAISTAPLLQPMWFVRDLLVVVFCSPVLYYFLKPNKFGNFSRRSIIVILGLLFLFCTNTSLIFSGFNITAFFFFCLGALLQLNSIDFAKILLRFSNVIFFLAVVLLIFDSAYEGHRTIVGNIIYPFWIVFGSMFFVCLSVKIVEYCKKNKHNILFYNLSKTSFFVFAFHIFILSKLKHIFEAYEVSIWMCSFLYVAKVVLATSISVALCLLLGRFFPKISKLLGGI